MLTQRRQRLVEAATVTLTRRRGRGVLIPGGLILTVAHVIAWSAEGQMTMGSWREFEPCRTATRRRFRLSPLAVEPVADIAVLEALDGMDPSAEPDITRFDAFQATTLPLPVCHPDEAPGRVYVFTHTGAWVRGTAHAVKQLREADTPQMRAIAQRQYRENPIMHLDVEHRIRGGTSGSPVVTEDGRLFGVMSIGGEVRTTSGRTQPGEYSAIIARPALALPVWLQARVREAPRLLT